MFYCSHTTNTILHVNYHHLKKNAYQNKICVIIVEYHWDGSIEKEEIPMYKTGGRWYVLDDTVFDLIDDYE